jgi:hypothetical protein
LIEVKDTLGAIFCEFAAMAVYVMIKAEKFYSTSKDKIDTAKSERAQKLEGGDDM